MKKQLHFFEPPVAVLSINRQASGTRFEANAIFSGQNRKRGAMLTFVYNPGKKKTETKKREDSGIKKDDAKKKKEKVKLEVLDSDGKIIRTVKYDVEPGVNRIYWDLRRKGVRSPNTPKPKPDAKEPGGPAVLPGEYTVRLSHGKESASQVVNVITDPRVGIVVRNIENLQPIYKQQMLLSSKVTEAMDRIRQSKSTVASINKMLEVKKNESHKAIQKKGKAMTDSLKILEELIVNPRGKQGIVRNPNILSATVGTVNRYLFSNLSGPNKSHEYLMVKAKRESEQVLTKVNLFFDNEWQKYQSEVENANLSLFKNYEPIKIE